MKHIVMYSLLLLLVLNLPCPRPAFAQDKIGVQFVGGGGAVSSRALAATEIAGVPAVAQTNWNPLPGANGHVKSLKTDDGKPIPLTVAYSCRGTWCSALDTPVSADNALMSGYLDCPQGADPSSVVTVAVADIPYPRYDVYIYVYGDTPTSHRQALYFIGPAVESLMDFGAFAGKYVESTDEHPNGNYLVFHGLTGSSFKLTAEAGTTDDDDPRAPVNAIQIVKD